MNLIPKLVLAGALLLGALPPLPAQVPQIINYQGKISVGATPFTGAGQFRFALVKGDGTTTYWSNDGTSVAGSQPTAAVALPVVNGLYVVPLGDATVSGMAGIPSSVFANPDVRVRVWFNDGTNGSQLLSPDQRITSVGYAMVADTVKDGSITAAKLAPGAVTAAALSPGLAAANLSDSGALIISRPDNATLLGSGMVAQPQTLTFEQSVNIDGGNIIDAGYGVSATSLGTSVIFWGGSTLAGAKTKTGYFLNKDAASTATTAVVGAPSERSYHCAVWTGTELIIWGGQNSSLTALNTGGRYNPLTNSWTVMADGPFARSSASACWTGTEMLVWGGVEQTNGVPKTNPSTPNTGAFYNPATNTWRPFNPVNPPSARYGAGAAWTGTEIIILGGKYCDNDTNWSNDATTNQVATYNVASNTFRQSVKSHSFGDGPISASWTGTHVAFCNTYSNAASFYYPLSDVVLNIQYTDSQQTNVYYSTTQAASGYTNGYAGNAVWCEDRFIFAGGRHSFYVPQNSNNGTIYYYAYYAEAINRSTYTIPATIYYYYKRP